MTGYFKFSKGPNEALEDSLIMEFYKKTKYIRATD